MGFFDKFRGKKGSWPWPNIDSPIVRLEVEKAAVHEAGHAVVGRYFGLNVTQLSIRRRADIAGQVTTGLTRPRLRASMIPRSKRLAAGNPDSPHRGPEIGLRPRGFFDDEASLHAELHLYLAGPAAQVIQFKSFEGWEQDRKTFYLLVSAYYGNLAGFISDRSSAFIEHRYWSSCKEILSKPEIWGWVKEVAKAALRSEHGVLTGEEIESLRPSRSLPPDRPASLLPGAA